MGDPLRSDLAKHIQRIEPRLHLPQLHMLIHRRDRDALDLDRAAVGRSGDFGALTFVFGKISCSLSLSLSFSKFT